MVLFFVADFPSIYLKDVMLFLFGSIFFIYDLRGIFLVEYMTFYVTFEYSPGKFINFADFTFLISYLGFGSC